VCVCVWVAEKVQSVSCAVMSVSLRSVAGTVHHGIVYWLAALLGLHYLTRFCIAVDEALYSRLLPCSDDGW